jgi:hypothetical protein
MVFLKWLHIVMLFMRWLGAHYGRILYDVAMSWKMKRQLTGCVVVYHAGALHIFNYDPNLNNITSHFIDIRIIGIICHFDKLFFEEVYSGMVCI